MADETLHLLAATKSGLEALTRRELEALGYSAQSLGPGRVLFEAADASAIARASVFLRTADRVLVRVGVCPAPDFGVLFDAVNAMPWERWIAPGCAFPVRARCVRAVLSSEPAVQSIVKKAIVERLRVRLGESALSEAGPPCRVDVAITGEEATLTLDTTGVTLHKRGYRTLTVEAPLHETLAAAMVMLSFWEPSRPLVDPMCGSGTIPIEAAMIARGIAPGARRPFAAEEWPTIPRAVWRAARDEARARAEEASRAAKDLRILASDIDPEAMRLTRLHARQAGVEDCIRIEQRALADLPGEEALGRHGCVVTNPPYGERIGEREDIPALLASMAAAFNRLPSWSFYVLSPERGFERQIGRDADRRRKLFNATIECGLFQFYGPRPGTEDAPIPFRPAAGRPPPPARREEDGVHGSFEGEQPRRREVDQAELVEKSRRQIADFANRVARSARHLRRLPQRGVHCYRLFDADIPDVPLLVERYEDQALVVDLLGPRSGRSLDQHAQWLRSAADAACSAMDLPASSAVISRAATQLRAAQPRQTEPPRELEVREHGLRFRVLLGSREGPMLRCEHRGIRELVAGLAAGKRFLNLAQDWGAATVHAAAGREGKPGAAATLTLSAGAGQLNAASANLQLNGLDGPAHRRRAAAPLDVLRSGEEAGRHDVALFILEQRPRLARPGAAPEPGGTISPAIAAGLLRTLAPGGGGGGGGAGGGATAILAAPPGMTIDAEAVRALAPGSAARDISARVRQDDVAPRAAWMCWQLTPG